MFLRLTASTALSLLLLCACSKRPTIAVEDLGGGQDVSKFVLKSLEGTRDGDRLDVRASYGDGSRSITALLTFRINPQARLESGTWSGVGGQGTVEERSTTFLGGQSGPPSIGGRFDLIGQERRPIYRITIPLQQLREPL